MSKEITLDQLAKTAKANSKPAQTNELKSNADQNPNDQHKTARQERGVMMTPDQVAKNLAGHNGRPEKKEEEFIEPPIVENAFSAMYKTINERKERIEKEVMPKIIENAQEMAIENHMRELGIEDVEDEVPEEDYQVQQNVRTEMEEKDISDYDIEDEHFLDDDDEEEDEDYNLMADYNNEQQQVTNQIDIDEYEVDQEDKDVTIEDDEEVIEEEIISEEDVADETPEVEEPEVVAAEPVKEQKPKKEPEKEEKKSSNDIQEVEIEKPVIAESGDLDQFMQDLDKEDALNVVDDEDETPEEIRERFKEKLVDIKITRDPIDLSKFSIRKNAVNSALVLNAIQNNRTVKKADWVLYHTGRSMTFTECSGPELDSLRKNIQNSNPVNGVIESLKFIYNHTVDANKPSFEAWCKLIRTEDIESLYFGIYKACYSDTNLVARACQDEACKKTSLIDTDINSMVKFESDEVEKKFNDIRAKDTTTETKAFKSTLLQVSDDIVISYTVPTLYSTFIQFSTLKPEITDKYSDVLNTMAYIDGFFSIDRASNELIPIQVKEYPTNINKTILSKLKVYTEILKSLTNDQYNILTAKLANIMQEAKVTYIYPKTECPECHKEIPEEPVDSMLNLLFTRAQLVQIRSL